MPVRSLLIHAVLRLYPRRWRDRYADELILLMDEAGGGLGDVVDLALGGLRQRGRQIRGGDTMSAGTKNWMTVVGGLVAILVAMPTAIFIGLSLAYPGVEFKGVEWPLGIQVEPVLNWLIPVLPALALLVAVAPVVRIGARRDSSGAPVVSARILPVPRPLLLVIGICAALLGVVIAYGVSENLLEALR